MTRYDSLRAWGELQAELLRAGWTGDLEDQELTFRVDAQGNQAEEGLLVLLTLPDQGGYRVDVFGGGGEWLDGEDFTRASAVRPAVLAAIQ